MSKVSEKIQWDRVGKNLIVWTSAAAVTYGIYWYFLGHSHLETKKKLENKLRQVSRPY